MDEKMRITESRISRSSVRRPDGPSRRCPTLEALAFAEARRIGSPPRMNFAAPPVASFSLFPPVNLRGDVYLTTVASQQRERVSWQ